MESSSVIAPPVINGTEAVTQSAPTTKRRPHRAFGGYSRRRVTTTTKARERRAPIEECHMNSLSSLRLPLLDGISQVTFEYYLGEHQSQIFYGGLSITQESTTKTHHIELGRPIPIDLRDSYNRENLPPMPCLAVPTHIFRRFRVYRITSSSSWDLKKLAAGLSNDCASPYESDASCPPSANQHPLVFPSTTPKSGLSLITIRAYYPVEYMKSANELQPLHGSRKRVHLYPHYDEVVAHPNILTMTVNEFASRVLRGVAGSGRLLDCSTEIPAALSANFYPKSHQEAVLAQRNDETQQNGGSNNPTYLILPMSVYNRINSMKKMLLEGHRQPICPSIGWRAAIPADDFIDDETDTFDINKSDLPSWSHVTGLEEALNSPPMLTSKIGSAPPSEIRLVFVRRQSEDCGDAIGSSLKKSIFGPARIRRSRMKGSDHLVMKVKRLEASSVTTATSSATSASASNGTSMPPEGLTYNYVWSRDYRRSSPGPKGPRDRENRSRHQLLPPPLTETSPATPTTPSVVSVAAPPSSSVTTDDDDDTKSTGERWHHAQQAPQQQHSLRPSRSCLPPQRLEVVDRDLEKALQRSLADGRHNNATSRQNTPTKQESLSPPPPPPSQTSAPPATSTAAAAAAVPATGKGRVRQKRSIQTRQDAKSSSRQGDASKAATSQQASDIEGVKRVKSEAVLSEFTIITKPEIVGGKWAHRLRSNSPSANSDSGISGNDRPNRRRQSKRAKGNHEAVTVAPPTEAVSQTNAKDGEQRTTNFIAPEMPSQEEEKPLGGTSIPKLTLAIGENGRFSVKPPVPSSSSSSSSPRPSTAPTKMESVSPGGDDPYALPSSPQLALSDNIDTTVNDVLKKRNTPSPDPPVLIAEGSINTSFSVQTPPVTDDSTIKQPIPPPHPHTPPARHIANHRNDHFSGHTLDGVAPPQRPVQPQFPQTVTPLQQQQQSVITHHSTIPLRSVFSMEQLVNTSSVPVPCTVTAPVFTLNYGLPLQHLSTIQTCQPHLQNQMALNSTPHHQILDATSSRCRELFHTNSSRSSPAQLNAPPPSLPPAQPRNFTWNGFPRSPATMWTQRNEPLPPPDPPLNKPVCYQQACHPQQQQQQLLQQQLQQQQQDTALPTSTSLPNGLCFMQTPVTAAAAPPGPALTLQQRQQQQQHQAMLQHHQAFLCAAYPMLSQQQAAAFAMATAASQYFPSAAAVAPTAAASLGPAPSQQQQQQHPNASSAVKQTTPHASPAQAAAGATWNSLGGNSNGCSRSFY